MKKKIDIEKLVQWALRDELPKGRPVSDDIGRVIAGRFDRRRFSMSTGARPEIDAFGFVPGSPHEDAQRVADAVARISALARLADLDDVRVLFGPWLPIAADAVTAVRESIFNPQSLVVRAAISGKRPPWSFAAPKPYQRFSPTTGGRPRALVYGVDAGGDLVEMKPNDGRARKRDGHYSYALSPRSPLQWSSPSMLAVGEARAEYVLWRTALVDLACDFTGALVEFEPVPPAASALPWLVAERPSRVFSDGFPAGLLTVPLALGPQRYAAARPIDSDLTVRARHGESNYRAARAAFNRKVAAAQA